MTLDQILAIAIFLAMFVAIMLEKWHRWISAAAGAVLMLVLVFRSLPGLWWALNLAEIVRPEFWVARAMCPESSHGVNWQTIIFIAGMMVMIEGLEQVGFFRWLCLLVARAVRYRVVPIFVAFFLLSGFLAMFIDSITVLLFMSSVTVELARLLDFDPIPVIVAEIFAANTGGSATMCGDPPNIIIGTCFHYSFFDFLANTGVIAWVGMLFALAYFLVVFRKYLRVKPVPDAQYPAPADAIKDRPRFYIFSAVFVAIVALLVSHNWTGVQVALIGVTAAGLTLLFSFRDAWKVLKELDWRTLLFFVGLFVCVSGLEHTGVLALIARLIGAVSGGNPLVIVSIILWLSAFASGVVDNIPFAATMVPVITGLVRAGLPLPTLSWSLALGTDIGGNATPIGASANVVGLAQAEEEGYRVGWPRYVKYALPATVLIMAICNLYLLLRYF